MEKLERGDGKNERNQRLKIIDCKGIRASWDGKEEEHEKTTCPQILIF